MATTFPITNYDYQFHGGVTGYHSSRAILRLYDGNTPVAYVHFVPAGLPIPNDVEAAPWIRMYLPESQIMSVIDMVRNEAPLWVYFAAGSGFLRTGQEPTGEAE